MCKYSKHNSVRKTFIRTLILCGEVKFLSHMTSTAVFRPFSFQDHFRSLYELQRRRFEPVKVNPNPTNVIDVAATYLPYSNPFIYRRIGQRSLNPSSNSPLIS